MSENERPERSGIDALDRLARLSPDEARNAALVERVRSTLPPREQANRSLHRRVLATLVAASIAIALTALLWPALEPRSARAELIAALVATTQSTRSDNLVILEVTDGEEASRNLVQREPFLIGYTLDVPGKREVWLSDRATGSDWKWSEKDGVLRVGTLHPKDAKQSWDELAATLPISVTGEISRVLDQLKTRPGDSEVNTSDEGGLRRYDMRSYRGTTLPSNGTRRLAERRAYWVDPKTNRIQRMEWSNPERKGSDVPTVTDATPVLRIAYRYDMPTVRDVYDLGVPRDAKLDDRRPSGRAKDLLDRFDAIVRAAFQRQGTTMAVTVPIAQENLAGPAFGWVRFAWRDGDSWSAADFSVCDTAGVWSILDQPFPATTTKPARWPELSIDEAIRYFDEQLHSMSLENARLDASAASGFAMTFTRGDEPILATLPAMELPSRPRLNTFGTKRAIRVENDGTHERLIVEDLFKPNEPPNQVRTVTLDAKTGRLLSMEFASSTKALERWTYLEFERLPDGTELPSRWRYETSAQNEAGATLKLVSETRVVHSADARLPASWRMGDKP